MFRNELSAATTAIIKAFEQDHTQPIRTVLPTLVESFKLYLLEPARQLDPYGQLTSELYSKAPWHMRAMAVYLESVLVIIYVVKKIIEYLVTFVTTAYGNGVKSILYVLDTSEKQNGAINVLALLFLAYLSYGFINFLIEHLFQSTGVDSPTVLFLNKIGESKTMETPKESESRINKTLKARKILFGKTAKREELLEKGKEVERMQGMAAAAEGKEPLNKTEL